MAVDGLAAVVPAKDKPIWPSGDMRGEKATTGPPRRVPAHIGVSVRRSDCHHDPASA
jgi:hypothetical protein